MEDRPRGLMDDKTRNQVREEYEEDKQHTLQILTQTPSKWRIVDLANGSVYKSVKGRWVYVGNLHNPGGYEKSNLKGAAF